MNSDAFLILFLVFIALISIFPLILRKWGIPGVIALLIAGMLIGPNAGDLVGHAAKWLSFLGTPSLRVVQNFSFFITSLGSLGLVFLMALAGMEADFKLIDSAKKPVVALSILTFSIPALAGYLVYGYFRPADFPGKLLYASLFASHSVGIVFPVIRELKLSRTRFGAAVLISTVVTDVASIILLAVSVQLKKQELAVSTNSSTGPTSLSLFDYLPSNLFGNYFTISFLLLVVVYLVVAIWAVSRIGRLLSERLSGNDDLLITFLLLVIMATVLAGEFIGINLVVGAFIAGLALSGYMHKNQKGTAVFYKFEGIGYGLLIPFLFISIGMQTDFSAFTAPGNLSILLLTVGGLVVSKIFSGWLAMRVSGFPNDKGICAGLMTVPQLSATLAAAAIGKNLGMLDDNFFNAIIILSIVTTLPIPSLVRAIMLKRKMSFESVDTEAYKLPEYIEDDIL
ncbi:MAG: cation:proton antiporter [Victivallaceae bacterium]|nr:cation:proton antiporter [Victivallaceae bacterium]